MLHADKGAFLSSVQRDAVQLHKQELEYFMLRYVALATVSSILVGFCWMGLIKSGELFRAACSSVADELTHHGCDGNTTAHHRDPNLVAAFYVAEIAVALTNLHDHGIIHRDVRLSVQQWSATAVERRGIHPFRARVGASAV